MSCGGKRALLRKSSSYVKTEYVLFDSAHYTDKANKQFAEIMWSGTPFETGSFNLKQLFQP